MAKTLTVNFPNMPADSDVEVLHLGLFKNGAKAELTDEQVAAYEVNYGPFPADSVYLGEPTKGSKATLLAQPAKNGPDPARETALDEALRSAPVAQESTDSAPAADTTTTTDVANEGGK